LKKNPISSLEALAPNYQSMVCNITEERTPQLRGGGSLTLRILCCLAAVTGHCSSIAQQKPIPDKITKNRFF
jgi:hypothetical protein